MGNRCADHATPLYPQKLALTSPTGGGRSVGIVRSRTKATESFFLSFRRRKVEVYALLRSCVVSVDSFLSIFRNSISVPSFGVEISSKNCFCINFWITKSRKDIYNTIARESDAVAFLAAFD